MRARAAIGVDDDLAAGQPRVAVGSADLETAGRVDMIDGVRGQQLGGQHVGDHPEHIFAKLGIFRLVALVLVEEVTWRVLRRYDDRGRLDRALVGVAQRDLALGVGLEERRSEEHTSELQSLMRISYAVFCLNKKTKNTQLRIETTRTQDAINMMHSQYMMITHQHTTLN